MRAALICLLGAGLLAGCAVTGRPFAPVHAHSERSVIYVYRPYRYAGSLIAPAVTCGNSAVKIGPGGYHAFVVKPGMVRCGADTEMGDEVELAIAPGTVNYIKEEIGWGVLIGHPHLYPMDADTAQNEVRSCCKQQ